MKNGQKDIPMYSIGTAAAMIGVSVQTLRLYEYEGLLVIHKTKGNQRLYSLSDIERIECIRRSINDEKISIGGMKHIHGMVPCWDIVNCSEEERQHCAAFNHHIGGCWTYQHEHSVCATKECRLCNVYKRSSNCEEIKALIIRSSLARQPEPHETNP
ncbi:MAG: MerR family transcriptional regulator [Bacteriovoracaceae bacterium]|nr:MerR family transcriptional regulator [Bacteroidota bacterium]